MPRANALGRAQDAAVWPPRATVARARGATAAVRCWPWRACA